tara:strand:- start:19901 stop:20791 length:891 start_codon:yes stop_codon:yes gene_type:complete
MRRWLFWVRRADGGNQWVWSKEFKDHGEAGDWLREQEPGLIVQAGPYISTDSAMERLGQREADGEMTFPYHAYGDPRNAQDWSIAEMDTNQQEAARRRDAGNLGSTIRNWLRDRGGIDPLSNFGFGLAGDIESALQSASNLAGPAGVGIGMGDSPTFDPRGILNTGGVQGAFGFANRVFNDLANMIPQTGTIQAPGEITPAMLAEINPQSTGSNAARAGNQLAMAAMQGVNPFFANTFGAPALGSLTAQFLDQAAARPDTAAPSNWFTFLRNQLGNQVFTPQANYDWSAGLSSPQR